PAGPTPPQRIHAYRASLLGLGSLFSETFYSEGRVPGTPNSGREMKKALKARKIKDLHDVVGMKLM
ncbi:MAG: hypothetical protein KDA21_15350, partial [Phycisphaerales bacterium]|nr:hypothetical protein [Phycisphaerales bacterium]